MADDMTLSSIAPRWKRLGALLLDIAILLFLKAVVIFTISHLGILDVDSDIGFYIFEEIFFFCAILLYFPIITIVWCTTPGKWLLSMRVVSESGYIAPAGMIILRETIGKWVLSPIVFGHIWLFFNWKRKNLWDYLAHTVVIDLKRQKVVSKSSEKFTERAKTNRIS
jgi:uncharacterized RDD family membrane protein YckC